MKLVISKVDLCLETSVGSCLTYIYDYVLRSGAQFQNYMQEFFKTAHNIFSTCFQSHCEFSKQMDNKCRNHSWGQKFQYHRYQRCWMCVEWTLHTADIEKCQVCLGCQIVIIITI